MTNSSQPDASAVVELVKRLRSVPDQFRAVPTSLTMNTSGVTYTASTGQFTPHPVAIEAATLLDQQTARLQELERDAERYRWLSTADAKCWSGLANLTPQALSQYIDAALAADAGKPL